MTSREPAFPPCSWRPPSASLVTGHRTSDLFTQEPRFFSLGSKYLHSLMLIVTPVMVSTCLAVVLDLQVGDQLGRTAVW